ncbi:MAG: chemotaxis protein CheW [Firmicutes bacterium]|nr:chemotaxis protein CheW [Bacillota bacterium]
MENLQIVVFKVGGLEYAVGIEQVQEIIDRVEITRVPHAPGFILGVFNLRGKIVPAIDLLVRLGLGSTSQDAQIIVEVSTENHTVGILVDDVIETTEVPATDIEPPSVMIGDGNQKYLKGIVKKGNRLMSLLDLDALLSKEDSAYTGERQVS